MKTALIILFSIFCVKVFSQITIDKNVKQQYDSALKEFPSKTRKRLLKIDDPISHTTVAIVTEHLVDVLNKEENSNFTFERYPVFFCTATLKKGTLEISCFPGFAQNSSINISNVVTNNFVKSEYHVWSDYDSSYRTNLQEAKTNELNLQTTTNKFILSDTDFVVGKTIYGYADITTDPYYQDNDNFKAGFIERKLHFKYYFKIIISKNNL